MFVCLPVRLAVRDCLPRIYVCLPACSTGRLSFRDCHVSMFVCLPVRLAVCLSLTVTYLCLSVCLTGRLSFRDCHVSIFVCLDDCPSVFLSDCRTACLLSVSLSFSVPPLSCSHTDRVTQKHSKYRSVLCLSCLKHGITSD